MPILAWDLIGARTAGCSDALIARAGVAPAILPGVKLLRIIQIIARHEPAHG